MAHAIQLKFLKLDSEAQIPKYQTKGAAGFDFCSLESATIRAGEVAKLKTGLSVEIPEGFELQIRARSGLAAKHGVFLVNGVGTIDSDYRGEIVILLSTCLNTPLEIKAGDRIAQGVLSKVFQADLFEVDVLSATERDAGGFGSTGLRPS